MAQTSEYDRILLDLWDSSISNSDVGGRYTQAKGIMDQYLSGELSIDTTVGRMGLQLGNNIQKVTAFTGTLVNALGGVEGITERSKWYA